LFIQLQITLNSAKPPRASFNASNTVRKPVTSTLVLCEVSWVLEAVGRQGYIKPTLEKILSYRTLQVLDFDTDDLLVGASNMETYGIDFNDGVNVSMMTKADISEVYSNDDKKHLGKIDFLKLIFE
jgi:predicted nucleic acid-binding protein